MKITDVPRFMKLILTLSQSRADWFLVGLILWTYLFLKGELDFED